MKPSKYWQRRAEQLGARQFRKADSYTERLRHEYARAIRSIEQDIAVFYQRFADNNGGVSMAEAKRLLTSGELREFRMTLEEFREKAKNNADGRWTKELNNVYYKTRISRFEALQVQIRQQVETLSASEQAGVAALLSDTYTDTYYRSIFEIQNGTGAAVTFARIHPEAVEKTISKKWAGSDYSARIWENRGKLIRELETNLAQSFIRGDSYDRTTQALAKRMGVGYSNAARVVRTESSHIVSEATWDGYKASGIVKKYEILATLDNRTSPICRSLDGRTFLMSEKQLGINFPPLHPNCRTVISPYFDDDSPGSRIAKDGDGKAIYVSGEMTYDEWYKKYIDVPIDKSTPTKETEFAELTIPGSNERALEVPKR
ncbi:minor capsid protein [Paenibacillus thiaminolyticus]|uniref:minor capsid protein n=1 Tax=Paenibacillus thiaminolyticus TaxID=49283 RepID=UPI0011645DAE|nr:minor capsid protein [Paenibacillus thiaminolyticus]NGP58159.1 minor capsid protein [Paenibacillus thiaminolyticus]